MGTVNTVSSTAFSNYKYSRIHRSTFAIDAIKPWSYYLILFIFETTTLRLVVSKIKSNIKRVSLYRVVTLLFQFPAACQPLTVLKLVKVRLSMLRRFRKDASRIKLEVHIYRCKSFFASKIKENFTPKSYFVCTRKKNSGSSWMTCSNRDNFD